MKKGFTLAEVLITLGIIGVVSAMTVPSLMNNYQRQTYVTQLHKVYNETQQAFLQYKTDRNALSLSEAGLTSKTNLVSFMKTYFKVVSDCGITATPCFNSTYQNVNGVDVALSFDGNFLPDSCVTIASGAAICMNVVSSTREGVTDGIITVDTNGKKGPNIGGRDIFTMRFYNDGTIDVLGVTPECKLAGTCDPTAIRTHRYNYACKGTGGYSHMGDDCIGKIINDGWTMTY